MNDQLGDKVLDRAEDWQWTGGMDADVYCALSGTLHGTMFMSLWEGQSRSFGGAFQTLCNDLMLGALDD